MQQGKDRATANSKFDTHPMTGDGSSLSQLVNAEPTTPPAGPDKMLFNPEKFYADPVK
jgi:hypothetical protein